MIKKAPYIYSHHATINSTKKVAVKKDLDAPTDESRFPSSLHHVVIY